MAYMAYTEKKRDNKTDNKMNNKTNNKKAESCCESCEFYDYDEYLDAYVCDMKLDEDEMLDFITGREHHCPYYRFYDEYKSVAKQI